MQDHWPEQPPTSIAGALISAATALLIHAFVLVMLLAVALNVLGIAEFYEDWELSLEGGVVFVLRLARMFQRWWYLPILPLLAYVAFLIWLASKPSGRWLLMWLNYLALGSGLVIVTVTFGVLVRPLMNLTPQ